MSDKQICIHNKHHSIYEMGKLQHKLKSESELTRLQEHNLENVGEGVYLNDGDGGGLTAGRLQGQMSCAGVEAYGRRSRRP
jgi:hypothetical protein